MSATRISSPAPKPAVSPTAFGIVMVIGLVSFYLGLVAVGTAHNRIAPYWLFGKHAVQEQSIHVTLPSEDAPIAPLFQLVHYWRRAIDQQR
jgi:hypothetical protein